MKRSKLAALAAAMLICTSLQACDAAEAVVIVVKQKIMAVVFTVLAIVIVALVLNVIRKNDPPVPKKRTFNGEKKKTVRFIRHGRAMHNDAWFQFLYGDALLTEVGKHQARALANEFSSDPEFKAIIDKTTLVLVSPLRRTVQTFGLALAKQCAEKGIKAKLCAPAREGFWVNPLNFTNPHNIPVVMYDRPNDFLGSLLNDVTGGPDSQDYQKMEKFFFKEFNQNDDDAHQATCYSDSIKRLLEILLESEDENILVVTHGETIKQMTGEKGVDNCVMVECNMSKDGGIKAVRRMSVDGGIVHLE
jgi:broad specificity phosphatase PhoE